MDNIITLFDKGGPVMWILFMLSVYVLAVVLLKLYQFSRDGLFSDSIIDVILEETRRNHISRSYQLAFHSKNPVAKLLLFQVQLQAKKGLMDDQREKELSVQGGVILRSLENHVRSLELVAHIGPLLGLLGTVIGMVHAFAGLESAGKHIDPALLAGGIWQALLTTAAGLVVAIPAMAAYSLIDSKIEKIRGLMIESVAQMNTMLQDVDKKILVSAMELPAKGLVAANDEHDEFMHKRKKS